MVLKSFLSEVVDDLRGAFGGDIDKLRVLLPSQRSRLFFVDALARSLADDDKPIWGPEWDTIDSMMAAIAELRPCDNMRLITELYGIYVKHHPGESFDKFYFWGEILLSDFDQIDKYRVNGEELFCNISDIKEVESDLSYLTDAQRALVESLSGEASTDSVHRARFLAIWNSLGNIYSEFRAHLEALKLGYTGMIHRVAAQKIEAGGLKKGSFGSSDAPYVVVGFNALSECEKVLFKELQRHGARFYWDYDNYFKDNAEQEAGLFIRDNVSRFPEPKSETIGEMSGGAESGGKGISHDNFSGDKRLSVVACGSAAQQCKYVGKVLKELPQKGGVIDGSTAIVLTDESLLLPLLYALPDEYCTKSDGHGGVNVTMGFPLQQSLAYSFVERLIQLQQGCVGGGSFYHADVVGMLSHPYIVAAVGSGVARQYVNMIESGRIIRVQTSLFDVVTKGVKRVVDGVEADVEESFCSEEQQRILKQIFRCIDVGAGWSAISSYLSELLTLVISKPVFVPKHKSAEEGVEAKVFNLVGFENDVRTEFLTAIRDAIIQLHNVIDRCNEEGKSGFEITKSIYISLLRRRLKSLRIPFEGAPVDGLQVLGILETRTLDFDNVIILSMDDDNFPGNQLSKPSYVPYSLRLGYDMPRPEHHDGVFAYYFYRLIGRAQNVTMLYCSKADDKSTGEQSRYITQLEYESPFAGKISRKDIVVDASIFESKAISIPKKDDVKVKLESYLHGEGEQGDRTLSPTALFRYVACPMRFYYNSIAGIRGTDNEISDDVDSSMFGNILHDAMERLYGAALGQPSAHAIIKKIDDAMVDAAVDAAIAKVCMVQEGEYSGNLILARKVVVQYAKNIVEYDKRGDDFAVIRIEKEDGSEEDKREKIGCGIKLKSGRVVTIEGICDRVDRLKDGKIRIVDYKSGNSHLEFDCIDNLFNGEGKQRQTNIFQTLLYSYVYHQNGSDAIPALYFAREMSNDDYAPNLVEISKQLKNDGTPSNKNAYKPLTSYADYHADFEEQLTATLEELFNTNVQFTQCSDRTATCKYCDYKPLCE